MLWQRRDRWCGGVRRPPETASAKCHPKNSYVILVIGAFVQMKPARLPSWYLHYVNPDCGSIQPMDVTGDDTAKNLSAPQRDVMKLIVRARSNKEIASILNLAESSVKILMAKGCLQSVEACLALAHKTKELDTRAALLEFAYEFRTVAKRLERDERMVRAASPIHGVSPRGSSHERDS
jgi:regulatory LuxR family protein